MTALVAVGQEKVGEEEGGRDGKGRIRGVEREKSSGEKEKGTLVPAIGTPFSRFLPLDARTRVTRRTALNAISER